MSEIDANRIHTGDAFEVLDDMPESSVHAVVTDPPYGLNFMGKDWDNFRRRNNENDAGRDSVHGRMSQSAPASGAETDMLEYQKWCRKWADLCLNVLKPGGHLLAFSGNRTHHRLFSGVEDAGFEIRDTLTWHYGSGFPKALDVSKAIDKAADAEREVVNTKLKNDMTGGNYGTAESTDGEGNPNNKTVKYTAPATDAAEEWDGFKTALKPATEFVVLARAPLSEGTVAENVQTHGTGALNIDGTRVGTGSDDNRNGEESSERRYTNDGGTDFAAKPGPRGGSDKGRYPANVVFDEIEAERLDREVGELDGAGYETGGEFDSGEGATYDLNNQKSDGYTDSGGPSRYYYTSKATKAERTLDGRIDNAHPTVKPVDLMEWLVRLVTAEGQTVLDPFAGTGTTCKAAKDIGREFVGIEKQPQWADVARARVGLTPNDPNRLTDDDQQTLAEVQR